MRISVSLMLLIALALILPGGFLLLPLAYAKHRKSSGRLQKGPLWG